MWRSKKTLLRASWIISKSLCGILSGIGMGSRRLIKSCFVKSKIWRQVPTRYCSLRPSPMFPITGQGTPGSIGDQIIHFEIFFGLSLHGSWNKSGYDTQTGSSFFNGKVLSRAQFFHFCILKQIRTQNPHRSRVLSGFISMRFILTRLDLAQILTSLGFSKEIQFVNIRQNCIHNVRWVVASLSIDAKFFRYVNERFQKEITVNFYELFTKVSCFLIVIVWQTCINKKFHNSTDINIDCPQFYSFLKGFRLEAMQTSSSVSFHIPKLICGDKSSHFFCHLWRWDKVSILGFVAFGEY